MDAAQRARAALRRLAAARLEPTPDNYARAWAEEGGATVDAMPGDRARVLLGRLAARAADDPAPREALQQGLLQALAGRWEPLAGALDLASEAAAARTRDWALTLGRLARGLERGGRQWTLARRKDALQHVLDGSGADLARLQQRLQPLLAAWEADDPALEASEPPDASARPVVVAPREGAAGVADAGWPAVTADLEETVRAALPLDEPRAGEVADRLSAIADAIAAEGPAPQRLAELAAACRDARRWLGHRHHLVVELTRLAAGLGEGLVDLVEDESWVRGPCEALRAQLGQAPSARGVKAATALLAETRERQRRVRRERDEARDALKALIVRLVAEVGELGAHTGRFRDSVERHAEAIGRADSLQSLAGVVRELVDDSRSVHGLVAAAQSRLDAEQARAIGLETRVRELEAELRRLSDEVSTDLLTQVANRRGLQQAFAVEVARRAREGAQAAPLALGLIDIDNFKRLNDTLGHAAGDQALRSLAAAVRERLRPVDHLARFGGEEFVVLLPATDADEAREVLTRLQRSLTEALFMHGEREVFVTFSAGVTAWREGETLEAALERADEALYEAKRTGKNRTCRA